eukprot:1470161-Prorocentrum_lima.AAC.1
MTSLGLAVHVAARMVVFDGCVGEAVLPTHGILAGCMQSVAWTRVLLWEVLDRLHKELPGT